MVQRKKKKNTKITLLMCTQREILQNDLLRSAKLGPWQKEKQQLKMGVLFYFSVFPVVFPVYSLFSTGQIRVLFYRKRLIRYSHEDKP